MSSSYKETIKNETPIHTQLELNLFDVNPSSNHKTPENPNVNSFVQRLLENRATQVKIGEGVVLDSFCDISKPQTYQKTTIQFDPTIEAPTEKQVFTTLVEPETLINVPNETLPEKKINIKAMALAGLVASGVVGGYLMTKEPEFQVLDTTCSRNAKNAKYAPLKISPKLTTSDKYYSAGSKIKDAVPVETNTLIIHNTQMERPVDTSVLANQFKKGIRKLKGSDGKIVRREGDAHFLISPTGVNYKIIPTTKAAQGTLDLAQIKGNPMTVDKYAIQVEVDNNDNKAEAGKNCRNVSEQQIDQVASIIVANKIAPNKIYSHASVQGYNHSDPKWMGLNTIDKNTQSKDGKTTPELIRLVAITQSIIGKAKNPSATMKLQWAGKPEKIANEIILNNLKNTRFMVDKMEKMERSGKLKEGQEPGISIDRVQRAIAQNLAEKAKL